MSDPDLDVCGCGHYRFVHPDDGRCKPWGRNRLTNPCDCQAFVIPGAAAEPPCDLQDPYAHQADR